MDEDEFCRYISALQDGSRTIDLGSKTDIPRGYLRSRVPGTQIFIRALVDPGNLFGTLISADLAKKLHLQVEGDRKVVGTAGKNQSVTVLGRVPRLEIILEGYHEPLIIKPFVVADLAHPINLGQAFLRNRGGRMSFDPTAVTLHLGRHNLSLIGRSDPLIGNSSDPRFSRRILCPQAVADLGLKGDVVELQNRVSVAELEDIHYTAHVAKTTFLPPQSKSKVMIKTKLRAPEIYFDPKHNHFQLNSNELFFVKGLHKNDNGNITVWVVNFSPVGQIVTKNWKVGRCFKLNNLPSSVEVIEDAVNVLGHQSANDLTPGELQERREFLLEQLELKKNPLLSDKQRENVLDIFLQNFDSVSINGEDFGSSDLITFKIQTVPGAPCPIRPNVDH